MQRLSLHAPYHEEVSRAGLLSEREFLNALIQQRHTGVHQSQKSLFATRNVLSIVVATRVHNTVLKHFSEGRAYLMGYIREEKHVRPAGSPRRMSPARPSERSAGLCRAATPRPSVHPVGMMGGHLSSVPW